MAYLKKDGTVREMNTDKRGLKNLQFEKRRIAEAELKKRIVLNNPNRFSRR